MCIYVCICGFIFVSNTFYGCYCAYLYLDERKNVRVCGPPAAAAAAVRSVEMTVFGVVNVVREVFVNILLLVVYG